MGLEFHRIFSKIYFVNRQMWSEDCFLLLTEIVRTIKLEKNLQGVSLIIVWVIG